MTHDYVSYDYDYDYEADTNTVYVFSNAFQKKVSFQAANFEPRHPLHRLKQDTRPYHTISMLMCVYMSSIMSINLCRETIWFTASPSKSMKQKKQLDNHMQHAHICSQRNMKQIHRTTTCNM